MRACGACQLCCVLPAISELGKPANVACKHLTAKGCGIYDRRPAVCRKFECHWLGGTGEHRPDTVGAYTHAIPAGDGWGNDEGMMVHMDPHRFGRHVAVQQAIEDTVAAGGDVLMMCGDKRRLVTRNPQTLALAAWRGLADQDGRPVIVEKA